MYGQRASFSSRLGLWVLCGTATWAVPLWALAAGSGASPGSLDPQAIEGISLQVEKILTSLDEMRQGAAGKAFDLKAAAENAGQEPAKLLEWVQTHTRFVPYQGALRGPRGVLMDGVGSHLDRAWLLAELLRQSGHTVRLARIELTEQQGQELLAAPAGGAAQPKASAENPDGGDVRANGAQALAWQRQMEDVVQCVQDRSAELTSALGQKLATQVQDDARRLPAARDYWWVQRREGNLWIDLDLLGKALSAARETVTVSPKDGALALKKDQYHEVEIRVIVEQLTRGKPKESVALSSAHRSVDLIGKTVVLENVPLRTGEVADPKGPTQWLSSIEEWLPVLRVGPVGTYQKSFTDTGQINAHPDLSGAQQVGKAVGQTMGGIGGLLGGGEDDQPKPADQSILSAVWVEYELRAPGAAARTIRRDLADLIGPAGRRAGKGQLKMDQALRLERACGIATRLDILALVGQEPAAWLEYQGLMGLDQALRALPRVLKGKDSVREAAIFSLSDALLSVQGPLIGWVHARGACAAHAGQVYLGSVNLVNCRTGVRVAGGDRLQPVRALDVVNNEIGVWPLAGQSAIDIRLRQGILDTAVEALALGDASASPNTARLAERAASQGISWRLVTAAQELGESTRDWPADVRARLEQELASGFAVVVPSKPVLLDQTPRLAWWRVDLRTGQTLGILDNGLHGDVLAENGVLTFLHTIRTVNGVKAIQLAQVLTFKTIGELQAYLGLGYTAANADKIRILRELWQLIQECKQRGLL